LTTVPPEVQDNTRILCYFRCAIIWKLLQLLYLSEVVLKVFQI